MTNESQLQQAELLLKIASAKQDTDPVGDIEWADLIEVGIWANYHSPYPHLVEDTLPPYDSARSWHVVKNAAQAIVDSFTGRRHDTNE